MNKPLSHSTPFDTYQMCCELIAATDCNDMTKQQLKSVVRLTQCPAHPKSLKQAVTLSNGLGLIQFKNADTIIDVLSRIEKASHEKSPRSVGMNYPVFFGLQQIERTSRIPSQMKYLLGSLYAQLFILDKLQPDRVDSHIYYIDAYSCRDVLIDYISLIQFGSPDLQGMNTFRNVLIKLCPKFIDNFKPEEQLMRSKLDRFCEILTGSRSPGERQKEKASRQTSDEKPAIETFPSEAGPSGAELRVAYPTENSGDPKTISRSMSIPIPTGR